MPAIYLAPAEYATFGVAGATAPQVLAASTLVDAYLKRPEGLQWMPDYAGLPCYMAGMSPSLALVSTGSISPGTNVVVSINSGGAGLLSQFGSPGDVVIIDRATMAGGKTGVAEACVITTTAAGSITLASVSQNHSAGALLEFGLVIREQRSLPKNRSIVRLGSGPIARLHSGQGSYQYGRRNDQSAGLYDDRNLLSIMQTFGGPPEWFPWVPTVSDFNSFTNEVWIPSGIYMATYSDVRLYYVAGFQQVNIPPIIKQATAAAIAGGIATSDMAGGVKMARAGDTALTRFSNSILDADMRAQLDMFKARVFG